MPKQPSLPSSVRSVMPGSDPIGCALEDGEFLCERRNARDELDGARGVPNHCDGHAALMEIAPPACGMELRASKRSRPGRSGTNGRLSWPQPLTRTFATTSWPLLVRIHHTLWDSSKR